MTTLYNLHSDPLGYRITKFVDGEPEGTYIVSLTTCECPAGHRPTCRHRKMLPLMLERNLLDSFLFWDFDRGLSCDMNGKASRVTLPALVDENDCPGHVASPHNPKICLHCGTHVDSLRPDDEPAKDEYLEGLSQTIPAIDNPYAPLHAGEPFINIQGPPLNQFVVVDNDTRSEGIAPAPIAPANPWRRI